MTYSIPLKCNCGKLEGLATNISPKTGNHITCMCDDCQTFAHFLGNTDKILDNNGATHVFQIAPNQVSITKGIENLGCVKLSPKGIKRWYSTCCNTPVANTLSLKFAFVGLIQNFIDFENAPATKEQALGPITYNCMSKFGKGELPKNSHEKFPPFLTLKIIKSLLVGRLTKAYLPNSFFDSQTGKPISEPKVLTKDERNHFNK